MNPANPTQWVEEYEAKLADLKKKSEDLQENFAASTATVTSKDGAVTVTVGPNGGLQNLVLGHRAVELGAPRLTALILETARHAQKQAAEKVLEIFKPLGEGTEAYQMVSDSIPADEEEIEETDAYDIDDEPEPVPAPASASASASVSRAAAPQPPPVRGRRPVDDDEDDDNQPW
ncbi:YbaB/EbfC family nucleoid-associated protein [Lentzea flava]|uniref:YbaB/EbfC DNA-binding family protein n=1 Tax=Lentzea flava TaxID=103732 RepID=A0ABQ2UYT5_9PSEU|nr:YbaB/EbfC family nucleoid-associated protein [Lentzea flava]MCP2202177.1 YbaB/EbfC DNA-binding family protein [Lentzea flava]GGU57680.1 hypothetical protein GCM10010178_57490 [Lentzea flava]